MSHRHHNLVRTVNARHSTDYREQFMCKQGVTFAIKFVLYLEIWMKWLGINWMLYKMCAIKMELSSHYILLCSILRLWILSHISSLNLIIQYIKTYVSHTLSHVTTYPRSLTFVLDRCNKLKYGRLQLSSCICILYTTHKI